MTRTFSIWKAWAAMRLTALAAKYKDDPKALETLNMLISKLKTLRSRDLAVFIVQLHYAAATVPEIRDLLPSEEEVFSWL